MRALIAGNWKMHGRLSDLAPFAEALRAQETALPCELLVCPPATLLHPASLLLAGSNVALGGQDCHAAAAGAQTGEISAAMLRDVGATWVILGHSERRTDYRETDAQVRAKAVAAAAVGLSAIVCVGETAADRSEGRANSVVGRQLAGSLPDGFAGVVAYEPIWAIGTGQTPADADVVAMHGFIRAELVARFGAVGAGLRIVYGGSVKPANAAGLLGLPGVAGALVGGASLQAADFLGIARVAPGQVG